MDAIEKKLQECFDTLEEIANSDYWPFASPAPCSTEEKIKTGINSAMRWVDTALFWHREMFTKVGRDCMKAPAMTVVKIK